MTQARATARRTSLEKHKDEVIALLLTGWNQEQVATKYKVNPSSVHRFIDRHSDKLSALQAEVTRQVEDLAIANKVNRLMILEDLVDKSQVWLAEHTLSETTTRFDEDGNIVGETIRYRSDAVNAIRGLLKAAAEELDQLPRGTGSAQGVVREVIFREYGLDLDRIG